MRSRRLVAIPVAIAAWLAFMPAALAGGWATVTLSSPPAEPTAGGATTIDLTVLQHGETAVSWPRITVVATDAATGAMVRAEAEATPGAQGRYTAALTFPTDGSWTLTFESPDLLMEGTTTLTVATPAALPASRAASATADLAPIIGMGALALLFIVALGALVLHDRRADRGGQPQASGG